MSSRRAKKRKVGDEEGISDWEKRKPWKYMGLKRISSIRFSEDELEQFDHLYAQFCKLSSDDFASYKKALLEWVESGQQRVESGQQVRKVSYMLWERFEHEGIKLEWEREPEPKRPLTRLAAKIQKKKQDPYFGLAKADEEILSILKANTKCYRATTHFPSSDEMLESVSMSMSIKKYVFGGFHVGVYFIRSYKDDPLVDCSAPTPMSIKSDIAEEEYIVTPSGDGDGGPLFILFLEDVHILHRLSCQRFHIRFPCIMISPPSGCPTDLATRMFLKKVHLDLKLPVLAFGGCHPAWFSTLSFYSSGDLGVPGIRCLGLTVSDVHNYKDYIFQRYRMMQPHQLNSMLTLMLEGVDVKESLPLIHSDELADPRWMTDSCLMNYLALKFQEKLES